MPAGKWDKESGAAAGTGGARWASKSKSQKSAWLKRTGRRPQPALGATPTHPPTHPPTKGVAGWHKDHAVVCQLRHSRHDCGLLPPALGGHCSSSGSTAGRA